jgi:hypothetical protein
VALTGALGTVDAVRLTRAVVLVGAVAALVAGCTAPSALGARALSLGEEPYGVGELRIWIRPQPEVELLCRISRPDLTRNVRVLGCYVAETRTIVTIDDAWVLMHELKHFFEGRWHDDSAESP